MAAATCKRCSGVSVWKVYCSNQTFSCHDVDWTCSCLFYTSNDLPCRHLMYVADKGHGFKVFPAISVHERLNTLDTLNVKEDLASAAGELQSVVRMSKLRLPKVRLLNENDDETIDSAPQGIKQVAHVRTRQRERANQVVLSSAEKYSYAKAMLEPLLDHLFELPSTEFYQELKAWKETVEVRLRQKQFDSGGSDNDDNEVEHDVLEADMISDLDPADAMDTAKMMDALETADSDDDTDSSSDDDEVPPTQPKKNKAGTRISCAT
ncbi:hypothetical protein PC111_g17265 [Phytophthora cactorum]|nr:hypothetical protein PC111_g17265 [Phytophthora cactorum]KAG3088866.1 hypothetical protein PC122_g8163 [Phytophthora cactorum]